MLCTDTFEKGLELLTHAFGPLNEAQVAVYWAILQDLPDGWFELGVVQCLKHCRFFPKPAEIREYGSSWRPPLQRPSPAPQIAEFNQDECDRARERCFSREFGAD